jgi:hypothetical protein
MNRERMIGLICLCILAAVVALGAYEALQDVPQCTEVTLGGMPWLTLC